MSDVAYGEISRNGLWNNNPALVQLLGLCPLLAVSGSVVNALGLGLATLAVLVGSNIAVSLIRHQVGDESIHLRAVSNFGDFYSTHRHQLCHSRPRRSLCQQTAFATRCF